MNEDESPELTEGTESVERQMRIHKLKQDVADLGGWGGEVESDCPPEIEEQFLRHIVEFETAPDTTNAKQLAEDGVKLTPPGELDDTHLSMKLWQVIDALAARNTFLEDTNHLSDRELYTYLWDEGLREVVKDLSRDPAAAWHLSPLGSYGEEEMLLHLKYFADKEGRARWQKDWPDYEMPPHEDPPHDRDRHLPQHDFGGWEEDE